MNFMWINFPKQGIYPCEIVRRPMASQINVELINFTSKPTFDDADKELI